MAECQEGGRGLWVAERGRAAPNTTANRGRSLDNENAQRSIHASQAVRRVETRQAGADNDHVVLAGGGHVVEPLALTTSNMFVSTAATVFLISCNVFRPMRVVPGAGSVVASGTHGISVRPRLDCNSTVDFRSDLSLHSTIRTDF